MVHWTTLESVVKRHLDRFNHFFHRTSVWPTHRQTDTQTTLRASGANVAGILGEQGRIQKVCRGERVECWKGIPFPTGKGVLSYFKISSTRLLALQCSKKLTNTITLRAYSLDTYSKSPPSTSTKSPLHEQNSAFSGKCTDKNTAQSSNQIKSNKIKSNLFAISSVHNITVHKFALRLAGQTGDNFALKFTTNTPFQVKNLISFLKSGLGTGGQFALASYSKLWGFTPMLRATLYGPGTAVVTTVNLL